MTTTITLDIAEDPKSRRLCYAYQNAASKTPEWIDFMYEYWNEEPAVEVDRRGNTLIDLIVMCENEEALKKLIPKVTIEHLHRQNARGHTVLHHAVRKGNVSIINILLDREKKLCETTTSSLEATSGLLSIENEMGETPLYLVAALGKKYAFECLENHGSDCNTQRKDGRNILHAAIVSQNFYMALIIVGKYPHLASKPDKKDRIALNLLATSPFSFKSGSMYSVANLGKTPSVFSQLIGILIYKCIPSMYYTNANKDIYTVPRHPCKEKILKFFSLQPFDDAKQKHILVEALARKMIEQVVDWTLYAYTEQKDTVDKKSNAADPLIQAIENGITELVELIVNTCPDSANSIDQKGRNILHKAAERKNISIYRFLKKKVPNKEMMFAEVDFEGNNILHHSSSTVGRTTVLSPGVVNMMFWDVYWFQLIRRDCACDLRYSPNKEDKMAENLFYHAVDKQRKDAEKVLKEMNKGLMVVATLIGTISFAAIFTIPGAFDQNQGYPLLLKRDKEGVLLFLGYDSTSLIASGIALGNLVSIQLSRFHVDDFYFVLPLKYFIAITALFYSTTFLVTTYLQALILEESLFSLYPLLIIFVCFFDWLVFLDSIFYVISYLLEILQNTLTYN